MMEIKTITEVMLLITFVLLVSCIGCTTGNIGSFSDTTFFDKSSYTDIRALGSVQGESSQTMVLYLFPYKTPPTTKEAMNNALAKYDDTVFLGNVAIESRQKFYIGYSRLHTIVTGTAYTAERKKR